MILFLLSFGVPLGLLVTLGGAILFFSTKHKKIAGGMVITGLAIMGVTIALIVIAVIGLTQLVIIIRIGREILSTNCTNFSIFSLSIRGNLWNSWTESPHALLNCVSPK